MFIFTLGYLRHYFKEERRKCASKTHIFLSSGKGHKRDHILPINGVPHTLSDSHTYPHPRHYKTRKCFRQGI